MSETKKCFKILAVYYLLLAIRVLLCTDIFPNGFPIDQIQTVYLLILSICLIFRFYLKTVGQRKLKNTMMKLALMIFLMILLRGIKYTVFGNTFVLGRYTWYLYYVPMLMLPMFLFTASLYVFSKDEPRIKNIIRSAYIITIVLIIIVVTNDFHQKVFQFGPDFANWDSEYTRGSMFAAIILWEYLLYAAAVLY